MVQLKNVVKRFNGSPAVDHLSLTVEKTKIFGLLGPNGAGKTTTIRMILNILQPDSGEILINGEKVNPRILQNVGYLPEERGLYQKAKLGETVSYFARLKGLQEKEIRKKVDYYLKRFELSDYTLRRIEELSKGNQQKVQFIISIIHEPQLLILDEPFSGLDPVNQILLKEMIQELHHQGTTILFSTHQMEQVEKLCEEIVLINRGKNVLSGNLKEIKRNYGRQQIKINFEENSLIENEFPFLENVTLNKTSIIGTIPSGRTTNEVLQAMINLCQVTSFTVLEPSLEQIFIDVVNQESQT